MTSTRTTRAGAALAGLGLVAASLIGTASPASAAGLPAGLFGQSDPTYDGVFRQSLALLAYAAAEQDPPADAVAWLEDQQCADGGFESFRADTSKACSAPDSSSYSGQDSNSTGIAAAALYAVGSTAAADDAVAWLLDHQGADGGWAYYPDGAVSDANSTGIVLLGTNASGRTPSQVSTGGVSAADYLAGAQVGCDGASADEDGAYAYQVDTPLSANLYATLQATVGANGATLPLSAEPATTDQPRLACPAGTTTATGGELAAGYVARLVAPTGSITCAQTGFCGSGDDLSGTAWAVLSLSAAGVGSAERDAALATLLDAAGAGSARKAAVASASTEDPGALALTALAAVSVDGSSSTATALVTRIGATITPAASTPTSSPSPTATSSSSSTGGTTSDGSLAPSGATPLTPVLAVLGLLLVALGAGSAVTARRGGARS